MQLNDDQRKFVEKYHSLAIRYARRWTRYMKRYTEELNDAALDGVILASQAEQATDAFVICCVRTEVINKIRYLKAKKRGGLHKIGELVSDPSYYDRLPDGMTDFDGMIASLCSEHQDVIRLRFKEDLSWAAIAKQLGGCIMTNQRSKNEAIKKLRTRLQPSFG